MCSIGFIGENGCIGSYLYDMLIYKGYPVTILDYRVKKIKSDDFDDLDIIIYTGGISTRNLCENLTKEYIKHFMSHDVLQIISHLNKRHLFIFLSTAAVYDGCGKKLANETSEILVDNLDTYSLSMLQRDTLILDTITTRTIGLRIGMACGISRRQRYDIPFNKMVKDALTNQNINVYENNMSRPVVSLKDIYRSVETLITNNKNINKSQIYNISSFNIEINDLAKYVSSQIKSSLTILKSYQTKKITDGYSVDSSKFCNTFNFIFKDTKESILKEFIDNKHIFDRFTNQCRICKGSNLSLILDLGNQPLVNNLLIEQNTQAEAFPLNIYGCSNCYHTQLGCTIPPLKMFNYYTYVSGVSSSAVEHFKMITDYLISMCKSKENVLELASNDGSQLDFFKSAGFKTYGVDPAQNICEIAVKKGHTIISDYWGDKDFSNILPSSFDIIVAQNVVAHVPDPIKFVKKCTDYMTDDTILYIQTSQSEMYIHNEFDTIYHEHMSFFTLRSFKYLAEACNLYISDMRKFPIHGTSYGVCLKLKTKNKNHSDNFYTELQDEINTGIYNMQFYYNYRQNVIKFKFVMLKTLEELRTKYTIVCYGAAAKGITMLNYIGFKGIEYIVDDCDLKSGKFTPGLNIPIVSSDILTNDTRSLLIIILPWNIKDELIGKINKLRADNPTSILVPFPTIQII